MASGESNLHSEKYFHIYPCCFLTKGIKRSLLIDTQRNSFNFIPNELYDILKIHQNKTLNEILNLYGEDNKEIINDYFYFLTINDFGEFTDNRKEDRFEPIPEEIVASNHISNAIIDIRVSLKIDFAKAVLDLEKLGCTGLQIRIYAISDFHVLDNIAIALKNSPINFVEILINRRKPISFSYCKDYLLNNYAVNQITLFGYRTEKVYKLNSHQRIVKSKVILESRDQCGAVKPKYFSTSLKNYLESGKSNSCLFKKISIDEDGYIKNCPSFDSHYGKYGKVPLTDIVKTKNFRQIGEINKSQISICKVCEFRRICPDCRVYTMDQSTPYAKPLKCYYDPYTAKWAKAVLSLIIFVLIGYKSQSQNKLESSRQYYDSILYFNHLIPKYRESAQDSLVFAKNKLTYFIYQFIDTTRRPPLDDDKRKAITWLSDIYSTREFEKSKQLFEYISRNYPNDSRVKSWLLSRLDTALNYRSKEFLAKYGEELKNILEGKTDNKNEAIRKALETVWDNDQSFRKKIMLAKSEGDKLLESRLMDSVVLYDQKNLAIVENVLKNHGWPSPADIGYKASQAIFLVIHHSDTATFFKYHNEILEAYKFNKIAKEDYELYIDRYLSRKFGYQLYGTQSYYDSSTKKLIPYPIKNEYMR